MKKTKEREPRSPGSTGGPSPEPRVRGKDWVEFHLKLGAPDHVALGGARFSGIYRRGAEPFRATRGEWKVFLQPTGWFEEIGVRSQESGVSKTAEPALNPESQILNPGGQNGSAKNA